MRNCESIIFIIEKGTHDVLSIPWTPQKIKFRSGGQNGPWYYSRAYWYRCTFDSVG